MSKRSAFKRIDKSTSEKVDLLDRFNELKKEHPNIGVRQAAERLTVSKSFLHKIIKQEAEIRLQVSEDGASRAKRKRHGKDVDVEKALMDFYNWAKSKNIPLNGPVLMEKAQKIAYEAGVEDFKATDGWFSRWKKRNGLVFAALRGEAAEADTAGAEAFMKNEWPELQRRFHRKDIFNTDETGIYFRALPDSTYVKEKSKRTTKGFKTAKDRITALVTCSLEGEKLPLLIIGQSKSPRCFKGVRQMPAVNYKSSRNAWMTGPIWEGFLRDLDRNMGRQGRKILVLTDNCSAHVPVPGLKNVTVQFLPANTTSVLQPCDQGIIRSMKAIFRTNLRRRILELIETMEDDDTISAHEVVKKVNMLQAMEMMAAAWKAVKTETIINCWRKGGFFKYQEAEIQHAQDVMIEIPEDVPEERFLNWVAMDDEVEVADEATADEVTQQLVEVVADAKSQGESAADSDDEDEDPEPLASAKLMRSALEVLERGYRQQGFVINGFSASMEAFRDQLRRKFPPKQAKLSDFF